MRPGFSCTIKGRKTGVRSDDTFVRARDLRSAGCQCQANRGKARGEGLFGM